MEDQWQTPQAESRKRRVKQRAPDPPRGFLQIPSSIIVIRVACVLAALTAVLAIVLPWYLMPADIRTGPSWQHASRFYSLLYLTDSHMSPVSWVTLRMQMCRAAGDFATASSAAPTIIRKLAAEEINEKIYNYETGKSETNHWSSYLKDFAAQNCQMWNPCVATATDRCMTYRVMAISFVFAFIVVLAAVAILLFVFILVGREIDAKKKMDAQAKKAAATRTFIFLSIGTALHWFALMLCFYVFASSFARLRTTSIYPMPDYYAGVHVAVISSCLSFFATSFSFYRLRNGGNREFPLPTSPEASGTSPEKDADYEYDANAMNWSMEQWGEWWGAVEY